MASSLPQACAGLRWCLAPVLASCRSFEGKNNSYPTARITSNRKRHQCYCQSTVRHYSDSKPSWYTQNKNLFNSGLSVKTKPIVPKDRPVKKTKTKKSETENGSKAAESLVESGHEKLQVTLTGKLKSPKQAEEVSSASEDNTQTFSQEQAESKGVNFSVQELETLISNAPFKPNNSINEEGQETFKTFVEELSLRNLPSVGVVIDKTQSASQMIILQRWRARMKEELGGEEEFAKYHSDILRCGSNFHQCVREFLEKKTITSELLPQNEGSWQSIENVMDDVSDVVSCEQEVVHPELFYRGKYDCVAHYKGKLCLIEWKTSDKHKPLLSNTYDNPLQVAAYLGALNRSATLQNKGIPEVVNGLLVIAYRNGNPATVHQMNEKICLKYWQQWLQRVQQYWKQYVPPTEL